ncbi:bifunctional N(6)-L-threonylcarbamoyladenine synthase/serine/threonine protein kinase [Halococcus saccharolyticus]|uniref:Probable bifunctional tRNA threonylcarbamoyladenosine biosynthesis protein n=1 Tax=Halococcus saccharolyticus DSM 5350 TaxID=1227455 RepID=M0MH05_9EURY|nr:bifunctional N(6)-L-threonylcarbamoyladenine synthase/serine/threonine protein kinase [Halococcus saccharolyticus]EMA43710.1 bifunctional UGMP family protein/serine/threonine protein kinase [Halococcus saccharolyticus DSM 5350]
MRVLGIEGTAWAASAAYYDTATDEVSIETDAYLPESGGIHPREAAEHMREAIPAVVEATLNEADGPIDAVAFSRGPGLGPCLRIAGTAARALAGSLDVPLVGVNHMLAHAEIGRHRSGFASPVCLNASGANAHVLGYTNGRYRILGETTDTGVGNALDKFTRHVGWSHPGGPKIERAAEDGEYVDLPYVVTGMDFSFSGIMSAAKAAVDEDIPVEDVCFSLQETVFGMLTEVAERALSLTRSSELVLGGGVGQNARLREMLTTMCEERGAEFFAPEAHFLRDNAGMIAVLGAKMAVAGDTIEIADSRVDSGFRPDDVPVTWRENSGGREAIEERQNDETRQTGSVDAYQGAEATVEIAGDHVVKRRRSKAYRHPKLDERLRRDRIVQEARLTSAARREGVPTPVVHDVDTHEAALTLERVGECDLREIVEPGDGGHDATTATTRGEREVRTVAGHLATLHAAGFVHGDPTTRNVRVSSSSASGGGDEGNDDMGDELTYLIDFGLGYHTDSIEDYAMDCHVFERSLDGTAAVPDPLRAAFEEGYGETGNPDVLDRLREIEGRGRYQ